MKSLLRTAVLSATVGIAAPSSTERLKPLPTSAIISNYSTALVTHINFVLAVSEEGKVIRNGLLKFGAPASCIIVTESNFSGQSSSNLFCATGPIPWSPKGRIAFVWPLEFPTSLGDGNRFSTLGVHLEDGYLDPESGCGLYEINTTGEVIGSDDEVCRSINERAATIIEDSNKKIDEWLKGDGRTI